MCKSAAEKTRGFRLQAPIRAFRQDERSFERNTSIHYPIHLESTKCRNLYPGSIGLEHQEAPCAIRGSRDGSSITPAGTFAERSHSIVRGNGARIPTLKSFVSILEIWAGTSRGQLGGPRLRYAPSLQQCPDLISCCSKSRMGSPPPVPRLRRATLI